MSGVAITRSNFNRLRGRCELPVRKIALVRRERAIFCAGVVALAGQRANQRDAVARSCAETLINLDALPHGKKIAVRRSVVRLHGRRVCMMSCTRRIAIVCQPWDNAAPQSRNSIVIISYELGASCHASPHASRGLPAPAVPVV